MSYEDEWVWWIEHAAYRVGRGASLLENPSEVSPDGWASIKESRQCVEETHGVVIFRGDWITDDLGTAAEVYVARYPWVRDLYELSILTGGKRGDSLCGLLFGYSAEAIQRHLERSQEPSDD